ncbi:hypothetical protein P7C73_g73, partial [Tremellales sp. Uapishka_1]
MPVCPCCAQQQTKFFCAACLQEGISTHHTLFQRAQSLIAGTKARTQLLLDGPNHGITSWRRLRAEVVESERRCERLREEIARREKEISARLSRPDYDRRRQNLTLLKQQSPVAKTQQVLAQIARQQHDISLRLTHARRVLVREAIDVFGLRKKGEWEIAGMPIPSPETFRLYPSTSINGALLHTTHLLSLITTYLSITLPFIPVPPPPLELAHVGRPLMRANIPFLGTTRWRDKPVLWMSSTASVKKRTPTPKSISKHRQFLTAFALLSHSVAYLAWSQGVPGIGIREGEVQDSDDEQDGSRPNSRMQRSAVIISATSILQLLHALGDSPSLGQRTHEPGTEVLLHLGFGLDVAKVVETVLAAEQSRWGLGVGEQEGWDLVEGEKS